MAFLVHLLVAVRLNRGGVVPVLARAPPVIGRKSGRGGRGFGLMACLGLRLRGTREGKSIGVSAGKLTRSLQVQVHATL